MNKDVAYLGNFYQCVESIVKKYNLLLVISKKGKENPRILEFCRKNKITYKTAKSINNINNIIKRINLDLFIMGSFGLILPYETFSKPKFGTINVHPGYLPFYRGRHPLPWALYNREKEVGLAVHLVQRKVDMGSIVERSKVLVDYNKSYRDMEKKILNLMPDLLDKSLRRIFSGENDFIKQSNKDGSYFPPMAEERLKKIISAQILIRDLPKK